MDERFFDAVDGGKAQLELRSLDGARFLLLRQFGYRDPSFDEPFIVPAALDRFTTDLTSVPAAFRWLVSQVGPHLLPAVLHDALIPGPDGDASYQGPPVNRTQADRIFRDAMIHVGVGKVRAHLMWAAVSLATIWSVVKPRWAARGGLIVTFGSIAVLGVIATLDLLDVWDILPWMGVAPWWRELALGLAGAVVIPLLLSLAWRDRRNEIAIAGVVLATLLHVTVAIGIISLGYMLLERIISGRQGHRRSPA